MQAPPGPPRRRAGARTKSKRKRSSGIGTVLLVIGIGLMVLCGAALAVILVAPPTEAIRNELVAQVKSSTGRDLSIKGDAGLTFFPALGFTMGDVSLSAPPAMGGAPFVRMKRLTVQVKLLPLLSQKVAIDSFILDEPVIDLRVDKQGQKSWDFAAHQAGPKRTQLAQADGRGGTVNDAGSSWPGAGSGASEGGFDVAALEQLELGDVWIINGTVGYTDEGSGTNERVDAINATLGLKSIASPFTLEGDLRYKGEQVAFNSNLRSLKSILGQRPADLDATVQSPHLTGTFKGRVDVSQDLRLDGDVTAQSDSVRGLATWLGAELPKAKGFGPFSLKGRLRADGPVYDLSNIKLGLDGATGDGKVTVKTDGVRPNVSGELRLSELDLNKYMPAGDAAQDAGTAADGQDEPSSIEDLINRPGPRVRGYTKRSGWSQDPIDFSALGTVDANLKLGLGRLLYEKIKVGRTRMDVVLTDRALTAKLNEMELYSGTGRGVVTVNTRSATPVMGANFNLQGVSAQPLLNDAAEIDWLAGKGQLLLALKSSGLHERQIINRLNGSASFAFQDGAITGFNVAKWVRAIQQGNLADFGGSPTEKTDFSELSASFKIVKGVAVNDDLQIQSPLLRATGEGKVVLPRQRVDYTVKPKIVASLSGQGGNRALSGIEVPVRVHGPFDNLSYTPDLQGIFKDPNKAADTVRELGRKFGGEKTGKFLDNLLGGNKEDGEGVDAKKLLDGFLGGR